MSSPPVKLQTVLKELSNLRNEVIELRELDWKLLYQKPIFSDMCGQISVGEPFSEIGQSEMSYFSNEADTTQVGYDG